MGRKSISSLRQKCGTDNTSEPKTSADKVKDKEENNEGAESLVDLDDGQVREEATKRKRVRKRKAPETKAEEETEAVVANDR